MLTCSCLLVWRPAIAAARSLRVVDRGQILCVAAGVVVSPRTLAGRLLVPLLEADLHQDLIAPVSFS